MVLFPAIRKLVGGWTNPFEKYARQIGSSPHRQGWKEKSLKPPPRLGWFFPSPIIYGNVMGVYSREAPTGFWRGLSLEKCFCLQLFPTSSGDWAVSTCLYGPGRQYSGQAQQPEKTWVHATGMAWHVSQHTIGFSNARLDTLGPLTYFPQKTNECPLKNDGWKGSTFPFEMVPFFRWHVSFQGSNISFNKLTLCHGSFQNSTAKKHNFWRCLSPIH